MCFLSSVFLLATTLFQVPALLWIILGPLLHKCRCSWGFPSDPFHFPSHLWLSCSPAVRLLCPLAVLECVSDCNSFSASQHQHPAVFNIHFSGPGETEHVFLGGFLSLISSIFFGTLGSSPPRWRGYIGFDKWLNCSVSQLLMCSGVVKQPLDSLYRCTGSDGEIVDEMRYSKGFCPRLCVRSSGILSGWLANTTKQLTHAGAGWLLTKCCNVHVNKRWCHSRFNSGCAFALSETIPTFMTF